MKRPSGPTLLALASGVVALGCLVARAFEPLRLNWGDPWSDSNVLTALNYSYEYGFLKTSFTDVLDVGPLTDESYRYTHYPPLAEIFYGCVHKVVGHVPIGVYRLFGIAVSGLGLSFVFRYVRELVDELTAGFTVLFWCTSVFWHMYADSIHQAPFVQAGGFAALYFFARYGREGGVANLRKAALGVFVAFGCSYDYFIFLPLALAVTALRFGKRPWARDMRAAVAWLAGGAIAAFTLKSIFVIGAIGLHEFKQDLVFQFFERATTKYSEDYREGLFIIFGWRMASMFTPLFLPLVGCYAVAFALRRSSEGVWKLDWRNPVLPFLAGVPFFFVFSQLAASQLLATQVLLPAYALSFGTLGATLWRRRGAMRALAAVGATAIVLYQGHSLFSFRRSFLPDADARAVRGYLEEHDKADFVISNIMADGHVQAYFGRHFFPVGDSNYASSCRDFYRWIFSRTSVETYHVVFFTEPESRFIDKSLWPLMANDGRWRTIGDPFHNQAQAYGSIWAYDDRALACLEAGEAKREVQFGQMVVYSLHRKVLVPPEQLPTKPTLRVDYGEPASDPYKIRGFSERLKTPEGETFAWARGYLGCDLGTACRSVLTKRGPEFRGPPITQQGLTALPLPASCGYSATLKVFSALENQTIRIIVNGHDVASFPPAPAFKQRDLTFRMEPSALVSDQAQMLAVDYGIRREDWGVGLAMMSLVLVPDASCPSLPAN